MKTLCPSSRRRGTEAPAVLPLPERQSQEHPGQLIRERVDRPEGVTDEAVTPDSAEPGLGEPPDRRSSANYECCSLPGRS